MADGGRKARAVGAGLVVWAVSFLPFSALSLVQAGSMLSVVGCAGALFFGSAAAFALVPILQFRVVREAQREASAALAFYFASFYFGQGVGAAIGGIVVGAVGLEALGIASAVCMGLGVLGAMVFAPD